MYTIPSSDWDNLDPLAELERLIVERTCECCGDVQDKPIQRVWWCREERKGSYVSKHWKNWRVCQVCFWKTPRFDKWIFPIIANMPPMENLMEQLVAVQPMQAPAPQILYMDFAVGPEGVRDVRGRTRDVAMLDDANFRLEHRRVYGVDLANPCAERTIRQVVTV